MMPAMGDPGARRVSAALCEIVAGRTPLGMAYAHLVLGSEIVSTARGLTRSGVVRRARRAAVERGVIGTVRVTA